MELPAPRTTEEDLVDLELEGRVVAITGGSDGLGFALASRLVREGAAVALCARGPERLERARQELHALTGGGEVWTRALDVTDAGAVESFVSDAARELGRLDALVNNAGTADAGRFDDIDDDRWAADLELKLAAATRSSRAALAHLRASKGCILNVLATAAKAPGARSMPSSVSRAAGMALTKALAAEVAPEGVRVNAVLVGLIESGQWRRRAERRGVEVAQVQEELVEAAGVPMGRFGRAEEFADVAAVLLSPRAGYVTGVALNIDGGLSPVV